MSMNTPAPPDGPNTGRATPGAGDKPPPDSPPDYYRTVARDMLEYMGRRKGLWLDIGSGDGGVALAIARRHDTTVVLVDPDADALGRAMDRVHRFGLTGRVAAVVASAENLPLPPGTIDAVVSRGSFYFWADRAAGVREVHRVLRPGGKAMIGGGLGSTYPRPAREAFIRRRRESVAEKGPDAVRKFTEARRPETFRRVARDSGLTDFEVVGEGGLEPEDAKAGIGIWLRFCKQ